MDSEKLAAAFEQLASQVRSAPIIGQKIVVHAAQGAGPTVGLSINVTGGSGSGDVIGQKISVSSGQNDGLVQELHEAAQLVRSGTAPVSMLKSLASRAAGALGNAAAGAGTTGLIGYIVSQLE
jgi:hypothetical protein